MVDFSAIPGGDKQLDHPTAQQGNVNSGGAKAFGVHRSPFTVHRSAFGVRRRKAKLVVLLLHRR
jgi:hypothetical protein